MPHRPQLNALNIYHADPGAGPDEGEPIGRNDSARINVPLSEDHTRLNLESGHRRSERIASGKWTFVIEIHRMIGAYLRQIGVSIGLGIGRFLPSIT